LGLKIRDGRISIIVRFLTYRQRHMVFSKKKELKGHVDKIFITENLTRHRYDLLKRLNTLRVDRKIQMSVRLSLTPSWFLQIPRTNESVSIGVFTTLFPLVGILTLLNLKLVLDRKIHSFWTHDGSVLVKETERSRPLVVKSRQDIYRLGGETSMVIFILTCNYRYIFSLSRSYWPKKSRDE
jgi:hypothetical protein